MLGLLPQAIAAKTAIDKGSKKYKSLDKPQKQAVNIGGFLLVLGVAYTGYKMVAGMTGLFKTITGQKWNEERKAEENKEKIDLNIELDKQTTNPTLDVMAAKSIADSLYRAFLNTQPDWTRNLWDEGTDEKSIYAALTLLKNKADWLLVSREYGMPRRRNLVAELNYELTAKEMGKVRVILSKIGVSI